MSILGVLSVAVWPLAQLSVQREKERELQRALWEIREAIDAYKRTMDVAASSADSSSHYPASLEALTLGVPHPKTGRVLYFLRRIPRDPFAELNVPTAQSWGLRSYQSPPDQPTPGVDVYDVYTRSSRVGLNGVPLKDW